MPTFDIKPRTGQVAPFLDLTHDLSAPQSVNIKAAVERLRCCLFTEVTGSRDSEVHQYLQVRPLAIKTASYIPAAYLQVVGGWRQCAEQWRSMHGVELAKGGDGLAPGQQTDGAGGPAVQQRGLG